MVVRWQMNNQYLDKNLSEQCQALSAHVAD